MKLRWWKRTRWKSPNGETQVYSESRWRSGARWCGLLGSFGVPCLLRYHSLWLARSGAVGCISPPSRTSRPVGVSVLWPAVESLCCAIPYSRSHGKDPRCPDRNPTVSKIWVRDRTLCVRGFALGQVRLPVCGASAFHTRATRLETRTKESNMCASHWVLKPKGAVKVKVASVTLGAMAVATRTARSPGASHSL